MNFSKSSTRAFLPTFLLTSLLAFNGSIASAIAQTASWLNPPIDLSADVGGGAAWYPQIAVSGDGTKATAVWDRYVNSSGYQIFESSSATIGGGNVDWGAVTGPSVAGAVAEPQIALSADGTRATAVWSESSGAIFTVRSSSATISGNIATWSASIRLSVSGRDASSPQISLSADGSRATAIWKQFDGSNYIIMSSSATISGSTATWSIPTALSAPGQSASSPQIGVSADGSRATAVWYRSDGSNEIVQTSSATISDNTATWSSATALSAAGRSAYAPQIGVAADGSRATAVWYRLDGSNYIVQSSSATISGNTASWSTATDLSAAGQSAYAPQIGIAADGSKATAVWYRSNGSNAIVQSSSATISGSTASWSTPIDLSVAEQDAFGPQIGVAADGSRATAVWYRSNGSNDIVQSSSATISGSTASWLTATDLSATGQSASSPQIAVSADGTRATAVWYRFNGSRNIIQSSSATITYPSPPGAQWALTTLASPVGGGKVTCTPNPVTEGGSATCTAVANSGFTLGKFSSNCVRTTGTSCVVNNVSGPTTVSASFDQTLYFSTLTVTKTGNGAGTVTSVPSGIDCGPAPSCSANFSRFGSALVTLTATPFPGSELVGWTGRCSLTLGSSCVVSLSTDATVAANFRYTGSAASYHLAQDLYIAYYGRPADPAGQAYWAGQADQAGGFNQVVKAFGASSEYTQRFGGLGSPALVTQIFQQTLHRVPEPAGLLYYVNELDSGRQSLASLALAVLNGAKNPPDSTVITNKGEVADYYTAKVLAGCAYGTEQTGIDFLSPVTADRATVTTAKAAINARCAP